MDANRMFERLCRSSTAGVLAIVVATVGCGGPDGPGAGNSWNLENGPGETEDTGVVQTPDTRTVDTVSPPDDVGSDAHSVDEEDTDRPDDAGGCDPDSACCRYWVDLKVRRDGEPVEQFGGVVELDGREIAVQCPKPSEAPEGYRCNYSPFDEPGDAGVVESSLRVDVGSRARPVPERVDVHLVSDSGSYDGPVDLRAYNVDRAGDVGVDETCRGSSGTVSVRPADIAVDPKDFRYGDIAGTCLEDGRRRMTITLTSERGGGCSAENEPCLIIEITDEDLPSYDKRHGSYQFGPDHAGDSGEVCRNGNCQSVSGIIFFERFIAGEAAGGRWHLELPDGETMASHFSASAAGAGITCD